MSEDYENPDLCIHSMDTSLYCLCNLTAAQQTAYNGEIIYEQASMKIKGKHYTRVHPDLCRFYVEE